jgi:hypothetical protein
MKALDEREMFESDDEVGVVFNDIKEILNELNEKLGGEYAEEESKEENTHA